MGKTGISFESWLIAIIADNVTQQRRTLKLFLLAKGVEAMPLGRGKIIIYSVIVQIMALMVTVLAAGAGHGSYAPARLLFPFTMLSTVLNESIESAYFLFGLIQFPVYGLVWATAIKSKRTKLIIGLLTVLHVAAVIIVFEFSNQYFPN